MASGPASPLLVVEWLQGKLKAAAGTYQHMVATDPAIASHLENFLKGASYVIPGASEEFSELIYAFSNILSYAHDALLKHAAGLPLWINTSPLCQRLQMFLTTLEQIEVFVELVANRYSTIHRWLIITLIVFSKTLLRLFLLHQRPSMQTWPIIRPVDRQQLPAMTTGTPSSTAAANGTSSSSSSGANRHDSSATAGNSTSVDSAVAASGDSALQRSYVWQGKRMGRVLRSLRDPDDFDPVRRQSLSQLVGVSLPPFSSSYSLAAEIIYTLRPLTHLLWLLRCGFRSWKPWLLSLALDATSLYMHYCKTGLSAGERSELTRRLGLLTFYCVRSPCYNNVTRAYILAVLKRCSQSFFPISMAARSCLDYLPAWQRVYFYTWLS
ncbi:peroxisomal membrane protein PEX16-like [Sycon ciliatum]|uniref:peroxisomal membrane protein PEX16-like n=1 Tax=Sycon ciliatum TaxID=27933 RepID=UPI0031F6E3A2